MHDIFISYSSKDQYIADAIINILESRKIKCWIAYRDASAGENYAASIVRAIKQCKICVLIFSEESNQSKHVLSEINSCVNNGITIIPFRTADIIMDDSLEYYLGRMHWLDALSAPIEAHINKLADRINGLLQGEAAKIDSGIKNSVNNNTPKINEASETRMVKYEELINLGYNAKKIATQLVENDYIVYNGIGEENEGTACQWEKFVQNSTETFQYLINGENKIVGDWSILALNPEMFEQAKKGLLLEKDITYEASQMILFPGDYFGYVLAITILPDYRNMSNYMKIITSFFQQIERYAEHGIFFKEWCMNVFSAEIENLIKGLGFNFLTNNIVWGKIYHLQFTPLPKNTFVDKFPKLIELYAEKV